MNSIIFTVLGRNELIFSLSQTFVHLLLHFVLVVSFHAVDIIACASDQIGIVDDTGSRLIGPTTEVLDRVYVSL